MRTSTGDTSTETTVTSIVFLINVFTDVIEVKSPIFTFLYLFNYSIEPAGKM